MNDRGSGNTNIAPRKNNATNSKLEAKFEVTNDKLVIELPIKTKSEANSFEHWTIKHARHKSQQRAVTYALKPHLPVIRLPCRVLLTRLAPRFLDKHDNLPMSFKYILDAICSIITGNYISGNADNDERITIAYDQVKSKEYGIRIEITF